MFLNLNEEYNIQTESQQKWWTFSTEILQFSSWKTSDIKDNNNESRLKINNDFASSFHNKQAKNIKNLISKSTTCVMVEIFFY